MSLTAKDFINADIQVEAINREVNDILERIDFEMKIAYEAGKHMVNCSVPIHFSIPNMLNADAQREIYSRLLDSLKKRGFFVRWHTSNPNVIFQISWLSDEEHREIERKMRMLAEHQANAQ